jgi:hypothetical protein
MDRARLLRPGPPSYPYLPNLVEGVFYELRQVNVLGGEFVVSGDPSQRLYLRQLSDAFALQRKSRSFPVL